MICNEDDWATGLKLDRGVASLRVIAHNRFDPLWKSGWRSRRHCYRMLAGELNRDLNKAHFKLLNAKEIERLLPVIEGWRDRAVADGIALRER